MMRREQTNRPSRRPSAAGGYTFIEVLFAVIILGVGSIMLAGMLPVAIKQSSDTRDEVAGRAVCESGFAQMQAIARATPTAFPPTDTASVAAANATPANPTFDDLGLNAGAVSPGRIVPLSYSVVNTTAAVSATNPRASVTPDPAVDLLAPHRLAQGSRVDSTDPRFQYLAFYGRATGATSARLIILASRLRNTDNAAAVATRYGPDTLIKEAVNANNGPMLGEADVVEGGAIDADRIVFTTNALNNNPLRTAANGSFVIVAAATNAANDPSRARRNTGRIFKLGARRDDLDSTGHTFDLQAGYDLPPLNNGPDGRPNTVDDVVDESMHAATNYTYAGAAQATGESVQVWLVGAGLKDATQDFNASSNPYTGPAQDVAILSVDLPLSN